MAGIDKVVACIPTAVFAVDSNLSIVAWNRAAEEGLGLAESDVLGTACYETVQAIDVDTGLPCYEHCPLVNPRSSDRGWVHSRVLEAQWRGGEPVHLDCMLLECILPSAERGTLSFIAPLGAQEAEGHLRAMSAMEALYPVLTRSTDLPRSLGTVVQALLQATGADVVDLSLLDPDSREPFEVVQKALDPRYASQLETWLRSADVLGLAASSEGALVAFQAPADDGADDGGRLRWCLAIPLLAEGRLLGVLAVASHQARFNLGFAARVLFAVGGQLSVFLRWALLQDQAEARPASDRRVSAPALRFYCFQQFRVVGQDGEIPTSRFRRHKALALLKLLVAHRGRPLHREALIEILWPDADPALASNNLRVVLHHLRHALEPGLPRGRASSYIVSRGDLIYLDPSDRCWSDVEEFERARKQFDTLLGDGLIDQALKAGQEAASLYTSEYLEEEPYVDWCIAERERLREVYVNLLQRLAAAYADRGQVEPAIGACRAALAADQLREEIHRHLIALLWKAGHRDEALRQYETCRRVLWQELEVPPDDETERLYRTILGRGT